MLIFRRIVLRAHWTSLTLTSCYIFLEINQTLLTEQLNQKKWEIKSASKSIIVKLIKKVFPFNLHKNTKFTVCLSFKHHAERKTLENNCSILWWCKFPISIIPWLLWINNNRNNNNNSVDHRIWWRLKYTPENEHETKFSLITCLHKIILLQ